MKLFRFLFVLVASRFYAAAQQQSRPSAGTTSTTKLRVGVLDYNGVAYEQHHRTFEHYLAATAGAAFDPPLTFELFPINFLTDESVYDTIEKANLDFVFANPTIFTCLSSESGLRSIATVINQRKINGQVYNVDEFGGLIITRHDNIEIQTVSDLKGKSTACISLSGFGSGLMQFRELFRAGLHYLQDVKQIIFMNKQPAIVNAVLEGKVDAGYIRTDQLERTIDDSTGKLVDPSLFKIVQPQLDSTYPFQHTTPLYPEWAFGVLPHVDGQVASQVEDALTRMADYARPAEALQACYDACPEESTPLQCHPDCEQAIAPWVGCDATPELAFLAQDALTTSKIAGWSLPASYMGVRTTLQLTGLLQVESTGATCIRSTNVAEAVVCPEGFIKRQDKSISNGCQETGLDCYGFDCLCSPCVEAKDVDFYPVATSNYDGDDIGRVQDQAGQGCGKFAICGRTEQQNSITFRAIDNLKSEDAFFSVQLLQGDQSLEYNMTLIEDWDSNLYLYEVTLSDTAISPGDVIMQVYRQDIQIENSPFRLRIEPRNCEADTGDHLRVADETGNCVCKSQSVAIRDKCVPFAVLLPSILVPFVVLLLIGVYIYLAIKRHQMDSIWKVSADELKYQVPPHVLGRGTFGMVLLAEYRGTKVAVKRALPPTDQKSRGSKRNSTSDGKFDFVQSTKDLEQGLPANFGAKSLQPGTKSVFLSGNLSSGLFGPTAQSSRSRSSKGKTMTSKDFKKLLKSFKEEMRLLSRLRHPCITTVMGAVLDKQSEPIMIMEWMQLGSLNDLLQNESVALDGETLLPILQDISKGLLFLHSARPQIIHGDLKAANVLVDNRFRAKVADFGLSTKKRIHNQSLHTKSVVGTPFWMAPELLRREASNNAETDIYSLGIVMYEIISRKSPYEGENHMIVLKGVEDRKVNKRPPTPKGCPETYARLMEECQAPDPQARPTSADLDTRLRSFLAKDVHPPSSSTPTKRKGKSDGIGSELTIFPDRMAQALQRGETVEPETIESVTVFFAEIVGLTRISQDLPPDKLFDMLDRLDAGWNALCLKHKVLRIQTVGDAFMAVTNVDLDHTSNHVDLMAKFAIDAMQMAAQTQMDPSDLSRGTVPLRAGMHCGPVTTHVVMGRGASMTPKFSVVGETVGMATAMARKSQVGRVQCSEETSQTLMVQRKKHVRIEYVVSPRGGVRVKGQELKTFWIQSLYFRPGSRSLPAVGEDNSDSSSSDDNSALSGRTRDTEEGEGSDYEGLKNEESKKNVSFRDSARKEQLASVYDYIQTVPTSP